MSERSRRWPRLPALLTVLAATTVLFAPPATAAASPTVTVLTSGLQGTSGSTIGPDGALYVTEAVAGEVTRIDPNTGASSTFASGLPPRVIGLGGASDVAFVGSTAYVLVTVVGADVGGTAVNGIYRVDGPDSFTVIADLGAYSRENPPDTAFDLPEGLQFALQPVRGGFVVSDGHHNRVLRVGLDGSISELVQFENIVPTGLEAVGPVIMVAEAGPVPHLPATGKVVALGLSRPTPYSIASGYSLLVDVELGRCGLFALSQGDSPGEVTAGSPALPQSGELLRTRLDGSFSVVVDGLDLPTSVDFAGRSAYIVTLGGEVLRVDGYC